MPPNAALEANAGIYSGASMFLNTSRSTEGAEVLHVMTKQAKYATCKDFSTSIAA